MSKALIIKKMILAFFSITIIKDLIYSFTFYLLNRVDGLRTFSKGKNVKIRPGTLIRDPERLYIGDNSTIGANNVIWAGKSKGKIVIGKNVMTGPNCCFFGFNHGVELSGTPFIEQDCRDGDIIIDDNVWMGANVTILPNIKVGSNVIIAAGAIVTKDVPPYTLVGGNPARIIKKLSED